MSKGKEKGQGNKCRKEAVMLNLREGEVKSYQAKNRKLRKYVKSFLNPILYEIIKKGGDAELAQLYSTINCKININ